MEACLLGMTMLIQETMAEETEACEWKPSEGQHDFYLKTYLLAGFVLGVFFCSISCLLWYGTLYLCRRCRCGEPSTPGQEPCSPEASSSTEAHEPEESEPASGSKPPFVDDEKKQDCADAASQVDDEKKRDCADVASQADDPMHVPDSFWKDAVGSDRSAVLRRLTNEQLADFARGMNVHEFGFVASFTGCATAKHMRYIWDLCDYTGENMDTKTFCTVTAASHEIDRVKAIVEARRIII